MVAIIERMRGRSSKEMTYEAAKQALVAGSEQARANIAADNSTRPEILYFLARDTSIKVRSALASNTASPAQADQLLSEDSDETVRQMLAEKIARLAPGLGAAETDRARALAFETLQQLAKDQATKVRAMLADALKAEGGVASEIIQRLAMDEELTVSSPVLQFSPVLTDADLLEIIASAPSSGALSAISRRSDVRARVSDAIIATDDEMAIADLLDNSKAQIREETLDRLADRAGDRERWHAPLVRRPKLSLAAMRNLARYVARDMIDLLSARKDIDPATIRKLSETLQKRIDEGDPLLEPKQARSAMREAAPQDRMAQAREMISKASSNEDAISRMIESRDNGLVIAALALMTGYSHDIVKRTFTQRISKPVVALCWKAGLSAVMAGRIQHRVAKIAPAMVVHATREGEYAYTRDELDWQLDFFDSV
tara:strand:+ start:26534 stop:27820 length:1287 start_codon:yes stop_codon:yes gene_type:complete